MFKDIKNHIAVSSLESSIHATKKNPKIITVTWFMGKRCNYDCSYCPSFIHDNYSPHIDKNDAFDLLNQLELHSNKQQKKIKISITGGEPFVHPNFLEILKHAKEKISITQLATITNGSLPLKIYEESAKYLTNITISLHLEQSDVIIKQTIDKIISLNKIKKWFLNVNLMALPNKLNLIKDIIEIFSKNKIKFILRKINPPFEDADSIISKKNIQSKEDLIIIEKNFLEEKIYKKNSSNKKIPIREKEYYSKEELNFFNNFENKNQWKNIKLHWPNKQIEYNTDELRSRNLNTWKGWQCYIGIDSIYIQHNGVVFRGNCMQGESIGKIGGELQWPNKPIKCPIDWCTCNTDMIIRKYKNESYRKLIDE